MQYGLVLPLSGIGGELDRLVEYAHVAEEEGWDGVFLEDYLIYWDAQGATYDPWLALAAIALRTQRVRLGTTVTPLPSRLPWQLARQAITLDHLSHGRLILGAGLGDAQDLHFGEVADVKRRAVMLDEGLDLLAGLMSGKPFSYQGTYYQVNNVTFFAGTGAAAQDSDLAGRVLAAESTSLRAARWDGFCPAKVPDEHGDGSIKPADIRAIKAFIEAHRSSTAPFDIAAGGHSPAEDPAKAQAHVGPYREAGATWWIEFVLPDPGEEEQALMRIRQGPPR